MDSFTFFPLAFRMKYINRWGLMRNTDSENLLEHSAQCAMLAHALAVIGNTYFNKNYNADQIATKALYHDISEIYTGDLPTPVKYDNSAISTSYKEIEKAACTKLLSKLPAEMRTEYGDALDHDNSCDKDMKILIKAADKLCALIKCIQETNHGNREFSAAALTIKSSVESMSRECPELAYFTENFLGEFEKSLDEL